MDPGDGRHQEARSRRRSGHPALGDDRRCAREASQSPPAVSGDEDGCHEGSTENAVAEAFEHRPEVLIADEGQLPARPGLNKALVQ